MKTTDDQTELFYHVDENDRELGSITRSVAHDGSLKIHRGVWALVFNRQGELFLQKRSLTKDNNPGIWSLSVGGHVTYRQTYEMAVKREFKEELGVSPRQFTFLHKYTFIGKRETEIGCVYKTVHNGPFTLHPQEIDQGSFFTLSDLQHKVRSQELEITYWTLAILNVECGILPLRQVIKGCIIKTFV
ncbi:MAG: NUDIX domain-containing protein [Patescibacteria group bacterium]